MRRTCCYDHDTNNNSIHNGAFFTDTQLSVGDIVKVKSSSIRRIPTDPHSSQYVTPFSPDYTVTNIVNYPDTVFMDVLMSNNDIYILGAHQDPSLTLSSRLVENRIPVFDLPVMPTGSRIADQSREYFIQKNDHKLSLGVFTPPLSYLGNISIINNQIYVLIYHTGTFVASGRRPSNIKQTGTLFTIQTDTFKVISFRGITLQEHFMLFSGKQSPPGPLKGLGNDSLYVINGTSISRFNPSSSPSWVISLHSVPVSATTILNMVIVLLCDEIIILDSSDGSTVQNHIFDKCNLVYCVGQRESQSQGNNLLIYLAGIEGSNVIITQATINKFNGEFIVISQIVISENVPIDTCYLSTWLNGYIVWIEEGTSARIYIYNNDNVCLSTITLEGISTRHTYQPLPQHVKESIPVLINIQGSTYVNDILTFDNDVNTLASGFLTLEPSFPQRAGIVTDIISSDRVYVVISGVITDTLQNLIPNRTYIIDKNGNLSVDYVNHNVNEGKPFLVVGRDPNSASISYNGI